LLGGKRARATFTCAISLNRKKARRAGARRRQRYHSTSWENTPSHTSARNASIYFSRLRALTARFRAYILHTYPPPITEPKMRAHPFLSPYEQDIGDQVAAMADQLIYSLPGSLRDLELSSFERIVFTGMGSSHYATIPTERQFLRD